MPGRAFCRATQMSNRQGVAAVSLTVSTWISAQKSEIIRAAVSCRELALLVDEADLSGVRGWVFYRRKRAFNGHLSCVSTVPPCAGIRIANYLIQSRPGLSFYGHREAV